MKLLINKGADVRSTDQYRITPLHWAAIGSSPDALNFLIDKGANVNAKDKWGFTPLHWVAKCNSDHTIADALVARGARTEARDYQGRHRCIWRRFTAMRPPSKYWPRTEPI